MMRRAVTREAGPVGPWRRAGSMAPYLEAAIAAASRGSAAVMEWYHTDVACDTKEDGSPVTRADFASNHSIVAALAPTGYPVLSEEGADPPGRLAADWVWVVDPLDGTSDFLDRNGEFTVMVALIRRGRPVVGVVSRPTDGTLYAGVAGAGAWRHAGTDWTRIRTRRNGILARCVAVRSRHHFATREGDFLASLGIRETRVLGSSLKAMEIGTGGADIYVTFTDRMKEWDTAASHIILHEAGGRMTDTAGNELEYNRPDPFHKHGILATNGTIHESVAGRLARL